MSVCDCILATAILATATATATALVLAHNYDQQHRAETQRNRSSCAFQKLGRLCSTDPRKKTTWVASGEAAGIPDTGHDEQ